MRVLMIEPPLARFLGQTSENFPIGLTYVASYASERGHFVRVYDAEANLNSNSKKIMGFEDGAKKYNLYHNALSDSNNVVWKDVASVIRDFNPDVIGISAMTPKWPSALYISKIIKTLNPKIQVVLGGRHATYLWQDVIQNPSIDFIVYGEGEEAFVSLLDQMENGNGDWESVGSLVYKSNNGQSRRTKPIPVQEEPDKFSYPKFELILNAGRQSKGYLGHVISGRGCAFQCTYCGSPKMWNRVVRYNSIDLVLENVEYLIKRHSVTFINFQDDTFSLNKKRVLQFCEEVMKRKIRFRWNCITRADLLNDELVKVMKRAGCVILNIGVESGSQRILDKIKKKEKVEDFLLASEILRKNSMPWSANFMVGIPGETIDDMKLTIDLMRHLRPTLIFLNVFTPYPGTELYDECIQKGLLTSTIDWSLTGHQSTLSLFNDTVNHEEFIAFYNKMASLCDRNNYSFRSLKSRLFARTSDSLIQKGVPVLKRLLGIRG